MGGEYFAISSSSLLTRMPMNIIPDGNVAPSVKRMGPPRLMSVTEVTHVHEPSAFLRNESMKVAKPPPLRCTLLLGSPRFKVAVGDFLTRRSIPGRL